MMDASGIGGEYDGGSTSDLYAEPDTMPLHYNASAAAAAYAQDEYYGSYDDYSNGAAPPKYDYSVLAVALITMGLIVPVEIVRHKIDHRAIGRPFAKTVLDFLYSEREFSYSW